MKFKTICIFLVLAGGIISCNEKSEKPESVNYRNISLTMYSYLENDSIPDKWDFYIESFWAIDSLGKCEMVRRDGFKKEQKYFETSLPDSTISLINTLDFSKLDTVKILPPQKGRYDGFLYCLSVREKDNKGVSYIKFIPSALNGKFLDLFNNLSRLMADAKTPGMFPAYYYPNSNYIRKNLSDSTKYPFPVRLKAEKNVAF
ncbi:hypothetical protein ACFP1I_09060 [Dyadobacter subterraneus]|uniref:Lipoprotein n=1 Tax=Dyadobacter subterraneus TaxID=2773304 RepID=A0ABR9WB84_9BACT|nr:hypothetical protein [Dyadobacter subterraneus]MBE9462749.1 hypothetical protein [Dyadobacter subterraneus]